MAAANLTILDRNKITFAKRALFFINFCPKKDISKGSQR